MTIELSWRVHFPKVAVFNLGAAFPNDWRAKSNWTEIKERVSLVSSSFNRWNHLAVKQIFSSDKNLYCFWLHLTWRFHTRESEGIWHGGGEMIWGQIQRGRAHVMCHIHRERIQRYTQKTQFELLSCLITDITLGWPDVPVFGCLSPEKKWRYFSEL